MMTPPAIDILAPSSMGVRFTPIDHQPIGIHDTYTMQATSAESNVLNIAASLGLHTTILTKFVQESPIAQYIKAKLRARRIHYLGPEVSQEGPWGYRHQFNFADTGYGVRAPRVYNDRAGEVGATLTESDFDLQAIFDHGVRHVHFSGLIASLSKSTAQFCLSLARKAKESGSSISFDLNYRASLWKNREAELKPIFQEIATLSDILIGNEVHFEKCLGIVAPSASAQEENTLRKRSEQSIHDVQSAFPNTTIIITTFREVISAQEHLWGALVKNAEEWTMIEPRSIPVFDRIGGGDAFVGGFLYAWLQSFPKEAMVKFAWACGALATTVSEDYASPQSEAEVWDIFHGNGHIKR